MRGIENWYRNVDPPPNKTGKYILCPNCSCKTSRKNILAHLQTEKCKFYDPHKNIKPYYRENEGRAKPIIHILEEYIMLDNSYVYNKMFNLIIEEYALYPLLECRVYDTFKCPLSL